MKRFIVSLCSAMVLLTCVPGCIEETFPTTTATPEQIAKSSSSLEYLLNGLSSFFMDYDTWGSSANTNDWGYTCQIYMREVMGEDFPVYDALYDYWSYEEAGSYLNYNSYYTWYYYYSFIKNANNVIALVPDPDSATSAAVHSLGQALGIRALMYMDLEAMFEFRKTEVSTLNDEAEASKIMGLTVPIVDEHTTKTELQNNPRAPFYTMYRFIMTDLNRAEKYLADYMQTTVANVDLGVVYGLKARLWLEMASRFDSSSTDLAVQKSAEGSGDGYDDLGVESAEDCYALAAEYAQKAISRGYQPLTEDEWVDAKTGFNTPRSSWMLGTYVTSKEEVNTSYYYCSYVAQTCSEPTWSMGRYGKAFRCISKALYDKISDDDWRKSSWVAPEDAGKTTVPPGYSTELDGEAWSELPAYANLKFRAGGGAGSSIENGLIASFPLMRVEEMHFIRFEAMAHTDGVAAAVREMSSFLNDYRYRDGTYSCSASDMKSFITEMMVQRRIEFWGEGINFFAYKRLRLPVTRAYTGTNFISAHRLNTKSGYVAPWMNYFIPIYERDNNQAVVLNPDASGSIISQ